MSWNLLLRHGCNYKVTYHLQRVHDEINYIPSMVHYDINHEHPTRKNIDYYIPIKVKVYRRGLGYLLRYTDKT